MKSVSIIAIAFFALIALCSSVPILDQQAEGRLDIYNDFLAKLLSGLVHTTVGTLSEFVNQVINENPLGIGKRDIEDDLAARIDFGSFLYDNILQQLFGGLVTNTFNTIKDGLVGLIEKNPLNVGKRDIEDDLAARVDIGSFLYDNILQQLFGGLVSNTFNTIKDSLVGLIEKNPLNVGKRAASLNLPFLNDKVLAELFGELTTNTANYLQSVLNKLLNTPFLQQHKGSGNIQQAQTLVTQTVSTLVQKFKTFSRQAVASLNDRQKLNQLVQENVADVRTTVHQLAQQLSQIVPSAISTEVSEVLSALQSVLVYWTSGLGGSLGPVIGPFQPLGPVIGSSQS